VIKNDCEYLRFPGRPALYGHLISVVSNCATTAKREYQRRKPADAPDVSQLVSDRNYRQMALYACY